MRLEDAKFLVEKLLTVAAPADAQNFFSEDRRAWLADAREAAFSLIVDASEMGVLPA